MTTQYTYTGSWWLHGEWHHTVTATLLLNSDGELYSWEAELNGDNGSEAPANHLLSNESLRELEEHLWQAHLRGETKLVPPDPDEQLEQQRYLKEF